MADEYLDKQGLTYYEATIKKRLEPITTNGSSLKTAKTSLEAEVDRISAQKDQLVSDLSDINDALTEMELGSVEKLSEVSAKIDGMQIKPANIVLTCSPQYNGTVVKCEKDPYKYTEIFVDNQCNFILPELGTWKISSVDMYPSTTIDVLEYKTYESDYMKMP